MTKYQTVAPAANSQERLEPYRAPTTHSDIRVPVGQALFIGTGVGTLIVLLGIGVEIDFTIRDYVLTWAIITVATTLGVFWWRLIWTQNTIMRMERWTGKDLPGGYVGGPPPLFNPAASRAEAARVGEKIKREDEIDDLVGFVYGCATLGTSETAQGVPPTPAARKSYTEKRDTLMSLGIGRWRNEKNHKAGWDLAIPPAQAEPLVRKHILDRQDRAN